MGAGATAHAALPNVRDYEDMGRTRTGHGEDFPPKILAFICCGAFKSEILLWSQIRLWV